MNLSPELWYYLGTAAVTILVSAAHVRGYRVPVLEKVLDLLHGTAGGTPTAPAPAPAAQPAVVSNPPITLASILDEIRKRVPHPDDAKSAAPQVVPQADGNFMLKLPPR